MVSRSNGIRIENLIDRFIMKMDMNKAIKKCGGRMEPLEQNM
jgi:hypothetical protein